MGRLREDSGFWLVAGDDQAPAAATGAKLASSNGLRQRMCSEGITHGGERMMRRGGRMVAFREQGAIAPERRCASTATNRSGYDLQEQVMGCGGSRHNCAGAWIND